MNFLTILNSPFLHSLGPSLKTIAPYLQQYGYYAIFLAVFLEDFGVPLPGETTLIAGALLSATGMYKIYWVVLLGIFAASAGDNVGYAIGHFGGIKFVKKFGKYIFLTQKRLQKLESFFERHGGKVVVSARFIEGFRQFNGIIAGMSSMPWKSFLAYNIVGAILWVSVWAGIAYFLGNRLDVIFSLFQKFELYVILGAGVIVVIIIFYRVLRRKSKDKANHTTSTGKTDDNA